MAVIEIAKIQVRRGQELQTGIPTLDPGEFGWAEDTEHLYIGKRIAEGAPDDTPTRILVEKDLDIFRHLALNTGTVAAAYRYREDNELITHSSTITIQTKLDSLSPSLVDFGVVPQLEPLDITLEFQNAIKDLFANEAAAWGEPSQNDLYRQLMIPAGSYIVSDEIELPPYTKLVGEGPDLTKITFINSSTNLFKTVDASGNDFDSGLMQSGIYRSREVVIKGMTLEYSTTTTSSNALISLDNVLNARVEDCILRRAFDTASTTTYGLNESGIGIEVRGTGGGIGSGDVSLCENIYIKDCTFDGLKLGIESTGSVVRPIIEHNIFNNLYQGINFTTSSISLVGPSNAHIVNNRFQNIVEEGVYVGPNLNDVVTNHIVEQNTFVQVANGYDESGLRPRLDDTVTSSLTYRPIITEVLCESSTATGTTGSLFAVSTITLAITSTNDFLRSIDIESGLWYLTTDNITSPYRNENILIVGINTSTETSLVFETTSTTAVLEFENNTAPTYILEQAKPVKPIIKFESAGNKTIDNFFYRKIAADNTSTVGDFYYAPLVEGNVVINDSSSYKVDLPAGEQTTFVKIPLTGESQYANVQYQMYGSGLSRKGKLIVNIASDGYTSLTDYYNYSQYLESTGTVFQANTVLSTETNVLIVDSTPEIDAMFSEIITDRYYVTGDVGTPYEGYSAIIKTVVNNGSSWTLYTESIDPEFDYSIVGVNYLLLKGDSELPTFDSDSISTINKNYIVLICDTNKNNFDLTLEYQIDTQI